MLFKDDGNIDYNEFDKFCSAEKPHTSSVKNVLRKYYFKRITKEIPSETDSIPVILCYDEVKRSLYLTS